ncbi:Uncharacterized protein, YkwD family [Olavius algarvensis Delta 1 endosymbiont]|nr:Uncharacterized protein, YkwD family [Olavius algarvensis Delta 1 endosymbiont]
MYNSVPYSKNNAFIELSNLPILSTAFIEIRRQSKTFQIGESAVNRILMITFCVVLLVGCAQPKKRVIVIKQNQSFRCESDRMIRTIMVDLVNRARSNKRYCGSRPCPPAQAVKWNPRLADAAWKHAGDMAEHDFFSHSGSKGSSVARRVNSAGYAWRSVGENIYAGTETTAEVVAGWLTSTGHCRNIMSPKFSEIGAACVSNPASRYGTYWTLVLAAPQ